MDKLMHKLEARLRQDARHLRAEVPPHLKARIDSSLRTARSTPSARRAVKNPAWLAGSLTGAAAAALAIAAIVMVNSQEQALPQAERPASVTDAVAWSVPESVLEIERQFPLRAKTAGLTGPLEEELENLRSDLERARENVEQDLRFTF